MGSDMRYKIYLDLDGVLVDFDKGVEDIGFSPAEIDTNPQMKARFWHNIGKMHHHGFPFWGEMTPMPDADVLWDYVKYHDVEILSATGHVGNAEAEKREWVKRHLGDVVVNLVRKSADKSRFAAPNHILVDDRSKSIQPWVAAGGIGILHTSAANTIRQLERLGIRV